MESLNYDQLLQQVGNRNGGAGTHARSTHKLALPEIGIQNRALLRGGHRILKLLVHNHFRRRFRNTCSFVLCV